MVYKTFNTRKSGAAFSKEIANYLRHNYKITSRCNVVAQIRILETVSNVFGILEHQQHHSYELVPAPSSYS